MSSQFLSNNNSGIGQAASELLKEMQKAQATTPDEQLQKTKAQNNAAFQQVLQQQSQTQTMQQQQQQLGQIQAAGQMAQQHLSREEKIKSKLRASQLTALDKRESSKLGSLVESIIHGQDKMTNIMNMALSGRQFSPSELLAMQAGVYRFSQELDLASKVVDKATGGIKQILNTQV